MNRERGTARWWWLDDAIDGAFFVAGALLAIWLGWILLSRDPALTASTVASLVVFWLLAAYVALPRLQQVLARIYVPQYFIGRTTTAVGILGDPVNVAFDGSADQLHAAMHRAGWVRADPVTVRSSWGIIRSAVFRRSYPSAPVSPLFVFDRPESFAYEQEVDGNASRRHHVRFWPVPDGWVLPGGHRVAWLAAGTYDRAVGLSLFTLQVTHKVGADTDTERDHIVSSVQAGSPEATVRIIENFSSAFHARNGGGDLIHTDGNLPIVDVRGVAVQGSEQAAPVAHDIATRHVPPPGLLVSGLMILAKIALAIWGATVVATDDAASRIGTEHVVGLAAASAAVLALWALTLARRRWARIALMAWCAVEGVVQLASLTADGERSHAAQNAGVVVLVATGLSVLILIAVSATESRRWVSRR